MDSFPGRVFQGEVNRFAHAVDPLSRTLLVEIDIPNPNLDAPQPVFVMGDAARLKAMQGAGLGLSIVRAICQAHGGMVDAVSEKGVGTTVTVELPFIDKTLQEKMHAVA